MSIYIYGLVERHVALGEELGEHSGRRLSYQYNGRREGPRMMAHRYTKARTYVKSQPLSGLWHGWEWGTGGRRFAFCGNECFWWEAKLIGKRFFIISIIHFWGWMKEDHIGTGWCSIPLSSTMVTMRESSYWKSQNDQEKWSRLWGMFSRIWALPHQARPYKKEGKFYRRFTCRHSDKQG